MHLEAYGLPVQLNHMLPTASLMSSEINRVKCGILTFPLSVVPIGIIAGMRPCGVIVLVGELFLSESKTQVYGYLHNFLTRHSTVAESIGM